MPIGHTTWTVLPHEPIAKLDANLWRVDGTLGSIIRRMVLARMADGRVLVHNAIALDEAEMAAIDAWGEVAAILVPNAFHRMDARIMAERYPKARVYAPAAAIKAVGKATTVHGSFGDAPGDATVRVRHLAGIRDREGVLEVTGSHGVTAVFNDMLLNLPAMRGIRNLPLGPLGQLSVPRFARWAFVSDKAALRRDLEGIAGAGLVRVIPGHGRDVEAEAPARLGEAIGTIGLL